MSFRRPKSAAWVRSKNLTESRTIHDPNLYKKIKQEQSNPYFKECRVQTCSHLLMDKDGKSVAIAFPLEKTGWKNPASHQNMNRSSETESFMRKTF